jgi:hypothetical protein
MIKGPRSMDERWRPTSNERNHPYGDIGAEVGAEAQFLLGELCRPLSEDGYYDADGQRSEWHFADYYGLVGYFELERLVPHIRATDEVSVEEMNALDLKLRAVRLALPLTEAERNWLLDAKTLPDSLGPFRVPEIELVSAGLCQVGGGSDAMRRWFAWRREIDEYAGQGTLDMAREALRGIVELLCPGKPLPQPYRELRGLA